MRFRGEYSFLSNMYPCDITRVIGGKTLVFKSAESAFQAVKCLSCAEDFTSLGPVEAKRKGETVNLRPDWENIKLTVMYDCLWTKFTQHPELYAKLKNVPDPIMEENYWYDTYWGVYNGYGFNNLGILLTRIRDDLRLSGNNDLSPLFKSIKDIPCYNKALDTLYATAKEYFKDNNSEITACVKGILYGIAQADTIVIHEITGRYMDCVGLFYNSQDTDINTAQKLASRYSYLVASSHDFIGTGYKYLWKDILSYHRKFIELWS